MCIAAVPEAEGSSSPWYLFNDFLVRNITQEEALTFQDGWKVCSLKSLLHCVISLFNQVPAIIYLERTDLQNTLVFKSLSYGLDQGILRRDASISL